MNICVLLHKNVCYNLGAILKLRHKAVAEVKGGVSFVIFLCEVEAFICVNKNFQTDFFI